MRGRARRRIALITIGVGIATALLVSLAYRFDAFKPYELKTVDYRFGIRGSTGAPKDVVVVLIDDVTFGALRTPGGEQVQWPFPRRYHARVIANIARAHPAAIAYDVQFTEPTDPADDNALIVAAARAKRIVLSTTEVDANGRANVFGGAYAQLGLRVGNTSVVADKDGVIRHMPYELDGLKSFGVVAAEIARGHAVARPSANEQWIDYAGPPGTVPAVSFSSVWAGKVPASFFRGKVVVIGPSAPSLQDVHATSASGSESMSGAEVQANAAETVLRGFPLADAPSGVDYALIVLLALVTPLASLRLKGWWPLALAGGVGALLAVAVQLAFDHGWVIAFTYPIVALVLSTAVALIIQYILEAFERELTRDVFSRFVPETVVSQVLARTDEHLRLGGESVVGTVMFTDLRGFTTFSEGMPAEQVLDILNRYLSEITDTVLAHGGTLVSYLGDGILAVFGAPLQQEDHADRALAAAREMLEVRLPRFNEWAESAEGLGTGFKMGIGLNTGPFMSGNVGSEQRLEYTAIGDTINTASRIEGMTKGTPYALFVADSTKEALTRPVDDVIFIDELAVRGRQAKIKLWSLSSKAVLKENWESEGGAKPAAKDSGPAPETAPAGVTAPG